MKKHLPGFLILSIFILIFSQSVRAFETDNINKKLSVYQCDSLITANETNPNFIIIDVRTPSQWSSDHLEGSINRNYYDSDFDEQLEVLPRHKTYLIHCQSGGRSNGTFIKMQNLEFAEVYDMNGGISTWKSASLPTTNVIEPKLMLVSSDEINAGSNSDTIKITVTNRANDILTFNDVQLFDIHEIYSDFNYELQLAGAEDYTFSVFHTPGYHGNDSTNIKMHSNGGQLDIKILFENGIIQNIDQQNEIDFKIYPNPASHFLQITTHSSDNIREISIININGKVVFQESSFSANRLINVEQLDNGLYFVRIKLENKILTKKLIINR